MGNRLQTLLRGLAALFALAAFCVGVLWFLRAIDVPLPIPLPTPFPDTAFEPLIAVILGLGSFVLWLIPQPPAAERVAIQARNNRAAMIAKVRTTWIDNVLRRSLYAEMRLDLPLAQRTDAVTPPQPALVQAQGERHIDLPPGTTILDLYDRLDRSLLILGAPGGGKTTLLLELCDKLLDRAAADETLPIPVVFNLASWAVKRPPLADWLKDQLHTFYTVPSVIAEQWVETDQVLPLLDGLDEVPEAHRATCVAHINAFRQEHGLLPLVVCSRLEEYKPLMTGDRRLQLHGAVLIQSLSGAEVTRYIDQVGTPLVGLRAALSADRELWKFAVNPLLLGVLALAYRDVLEEQIVAGGAPQDRRDRLFRDYIDAMFARRPDPRYPKERVLRHLAWIAARMAERSQTVFRIEDLQPDLLADARWRRSYRVGVGLVGGLSFGLVVGLIMELVFGLFFGLFLGPFFGLRVERIRPIDRMRWTSDGLFFVLGGGLGLGLGGGLFGGLLFGLFGGLVNGLVNGLVMGLHVGLFGGLLFGLLFGLRHEVSVGQRSWPNEGIHRSLANVLFFGLGMGLGGGLVFGLLGGLGLGSVLPMGLMGLLLGLVSDQSGGLDVIAHYILRLLLWCSGAVPLRLVPFCDRCVDLVLLRRAGGGYIFIHRMLLDYLASLEPSFARPSAERD